MEGQACDNGQKEVKTFPTNTVMSLQRSRPAHRVRFPVRFPVRKCASYFCHSEPFTLVRAEHCKKEGGGEASLAHYHTLFRRLLPTAKRNQDNNAGSCSRLALHGDFLDCVLLNLA